MLDDVANPAVDGGGLGPERLPVGQPVCHEPLVVAHVDAIVLRERRIELDLVWHRPVPSHRQCRCPPDRAGLRIEGAQSHQGVDHDHVGAGLQYLECGGR